MAAQEAQKLADEIFIGKFTPGYERTYWDGCTHGFAVRGDMVRVICAAIASHIVVAKTALTEQPQDQGWEGGCVRGDRQVLQQVQRLVGGMEK